jgi:uncharacterized RDD family membrane protein YckC
MACVKCGTKTNPTDLFCPNCGNALTGTCASCGKDHAPGDRFCRNCGTQVIQNPVSSAAPESGPWTPPELVAPSERATPLNPVRTSSSRLPPRAFRSPAPVYPAARSYRRTGFVPPIGQRITQPAVAYGYKGVFPRFFAKVLDGFFLGIPLGLVLLIVALLTGYPNYDSGDWAPLLLSVCSVIYVVIYIGLESGGGTPGKRILGMRIVDKNGNNPGFVKAVVRNLLVVIDFLPFAFIIGVILVATSSTKQRLGDRAAGTYIIGKE